MNLLLMGKKVGMTQVFSDDGKKMEPVTVVYISKNFVSQIKTLEKDGYNSLQLAFEDCKEKSLNKSKIVHLAKNNISPKRFIKESKGNFENYLLGDSLDISIFKEGEKVSVTGNSKGKGFSGVIKRHNHSTGPMSHGSGYHRGVGSMGSIAANRVFKGKKLPGRMGNEKTTVKNLLIRKVLLEENIILIKGSIPGPSKGLIFIKKQV